MKRNFVLVISAFMYVIAVPQTLAAERLHLQAAFTVAFVATPNSAHVAYCGGQPLDYDVEAHGNGYSSLGALTFFLQKTFGGNIGHGCLTLSTPDGDSLFAIYDLMQSNPNANGFVTDGSGKLAFTEGTGLFHGAKGNATFTAVFGPGIGFYTVDGKLSAGHEY